MTICKTNDCDSDAKVKGFCMKCYGLLNRGNHPGFPLSPEETCRIPGCTWKIKDEERRLCCKHVKRWHAVGCPHLDTWDGNTPREFQYVCKLDFCGVSHHAKGFCARHYEDFKRWKENATGYSWKPKVYKRPYTKK